MIDLLTSNLKKYEPFQEILDTNHIRLIHFTENIPEIQASTIERVAEAKAKAAYDLYKSACLVDDVGLYLEAYPNFPGVYTKYALKSLGKDGFLRLLDGKSNHATFTCMISCWIKGKLYYGKGNIEGILDPTIPLYDGEMPLSKWFIPNVQTDFGALQHRADALYEISKHLPAIIGKM